LPKLTFVMPDGSRRQVEAADGASVLEIAHQHGLEDEIEGACEGCMACSTCHVIVEGDWYAKLPPPSEEESDILDLAVGLTRTSRLGCQIRLTPALDGLVVRVPAEHLDMRGR
jgi:2Fe-2S ferredoxin